LYLFGQYRLPFIRIIKLLHSTYLLMKEDGIDIMSLSIRAMVQRHSAFIFNDHIDNDKICSIEYWNIADF
jgi:tRNA pseudouridine-54 N-methylase